MPSLSIPYSFTASTTAVSAQVNANFTAIVALLNSTKLDSDNIQTGGISTEALATGAVTGVKVAASASMGIMNLGLAVSVASNAMTIALKDAAGSDATASTPIKIPFRSSTVTSGVVNVRTVSAALSVVVSSGSTLGCASAVDHYLYVYALDNAGTVELAVSMGFRDEATLISTTAEGGSGAADSNQVIYSSSARSNVPFRLIGRLKVNQTTAGTWAAVPTEIVCAPFPLIGPKAVYASGDASSAIVNDTVLVTWAAADKVLDTFNMFTDATDRWTAPMPGWYEVTLNLTVGLNNASSMSGQIYKNGSVNGKTTIIRSNTSSAVTISKTQRIQLAVGDYIQVYASADTSNIYGDREIFISWVNF